MKNCATETKYMTQTKMNPLSVSEQFENWIPTVDIIQFTLNFTKSSSIQKKSNEKQSIAVLTDNTQMHIG